VQAGISAAQVKGQLAGLTMRLKNPKYGFAQNNWPVEVEWLPGGVASYRMPQDLIALWKQAREVTPLVEPEPFAPSQPSPPQPV